MKKNERGAYLVMMALLIVVLIGIAALAIDVGRLLVTRTEMQNAVDAASLAAAAELDGQDGARGRAMAAARHSLEHDARFTRFPDLLNDNTLPDGAFQFFCVIGSEYDDSKDFVIEQGFCSDSPAAGEEEKLVAQNDEQASYVRISLSQAIVNDGDSFTADLYFLPVLRVLGIDAVDEADVAASALAGRGVFTCHYPPMAICDPWEGASGPIYFKDEMPVGGHIKLRSQGGEAKWTPGNFGFLGIPESKGGAKELAKYLADPNLIGCNPAKVFSEPGQKAGPTVDAINTRFDMYSGQFNNKRSAYPPAPNIKEYPDSDDGVAANLGHLDSEIAARFGNGSWSYENGVPGTSTRYEAYVTDHETGSGEEPSGGVVGDLSRRTMNIAVLRCGTEGNDFNGKYEHNLKFPFEGFAEVFILDASESPGGPDGLDLDVEYMGWIGEGDDDFHVQIQLFE